MRSDPAARPACKFPRRGQAEMAVIAYNPIRFHRLFERSRLHETQKGVSHESEESPPHLAPGTVASRSANRFRPKRSQSEVDAGRVGRCPQWRVWQASR